MPTNDDVLTWDDTLTSNQKWAAPTGGTPAAEDVTFTPAGSIAATDVQAAIEEVAAEAAAGSGASIPVGYLGTSVATPGSANAFGMRIYLPYSMTFATYAFAVWVQSGNMDLGIYTAAGSAVTREGSFAVPAVGRATRTITGGPVTLSAGEHIIALQASNSTSSFGLIANGAQVMAYTPINTFPLPSTLPLTVGGTGIGLMLLP